MSEKHRVVGASLLALAIEQDREGSMKTESNRAPAAPDLLSARLAERRAFEEWALAQRVAYRDEQHGLCWYNAGSGAHQWIGWQARARATAESAPGKPPQAT